MALKGIAVFLDRDGTINEEVGLVYRACQLRLLPRAPEAIRLLNDRGIRVIVTTNQSVVARGLCTEQDIEKIHDGLKEKLHEKGAYVDAIWYCPHHENGEVEEYRKNCSHRKPNIGMLKEAVIQFNLDLPRCYVIGDQSVDVKMGRNAGCGTILVKTGYGGRDEKFQVLPDVVCKDLADAVRWILKEVSGNQIS